MNVLAVILARAGSKGLPDKCVLPLGGRPVIAYTMDQALAAQRVGGIVLTTDSEPAKHIARQRNIRVVNRPAELAADTARVDDAARHAIIEVETHIGVPTDAVVLLYGNVPVRAEGVIDRAIDHLFDTGADSVRTVAPIGRHHPDWVHHLDDDRLRQYRPNSHYRRQDLEPLYYHDGAVAAVRRSSLFSDHALADPQGFWGRDCRALVQDPIDTVDIDELADLYFAEALLRLRMSSQQPRPPLPVGRKPILTGAVTYARHERR